MAPSDRSVKTDSAPATGLHDAPGIEDYEFVTSWGNISGTGDGELCNPYGIAVGDDEYIYIADTENNRIQLFSSDGTFLATFGSYGTGGGEFDHPFDVAVDAAGTIYVADSWNDRIQTFDRNRTFVTRWGSEGTGDGQFKYPSGISVSRAGSVFIADTGNSRVEAFRPAIIDEYIDPATGTVEKDGAVRAVNDYLFGDTITRDQATAVVNAHLYG